MEELGNCQHEHQPTGIIRKRFLTLIAAGIANYTIQYATLVYLLEFYYFQTTQVVYMRRIYLFNNLIFTDVYLVTQLL